MPCNVFQGWLQVTIRIYSDIQQL